MGQSRYAESCHSSRSREREREREREYMRRGAQVASKNMLSEDGF